MTSAERLIGILGPRYDAGTRVKIIACPNKYRNYDLIGKIGVIRTTHVQNVTVAVEGIRNSGSAYGYFYLAPNHLTHVDEDNNMEENKMSNITNYLNAVKIKFVGDVNPCNYIYANFDSCVKVDDMVVVKPAHHAFALAKVVEVIDKNDFETPREIVAKVDMDFYNERVKARNQAAELKAKMQERAKKLQDVALYQMLAKDDPEMQDLLNRYQSLPNF